MLKDRKDKMLTGKITNDNQLLQIAKEDLQLKKSFSKKLTGMTKI